MPRDPLILVDDSKASEALCPRLATTSEDEDLQQPKSIVLFYNAEKNTLINKTEKNHWKN